MQQIETPLTVHTLGPEGTNCAEAARQWLRARAERTDSGAAADAQDAAHGRIVLHRTLEEACTHLRDPEGERLLSCAAYPDLHTLVFSRLDQLVMIDSFIMPTHSMVIASRPDSGPAATVATHPAPQHLAGEGPERIMANSNADAAVRCASGEAEACVTTRVAAESHGLVIQKDFGPVPMAFLVHAPRLR